jgi:hypothetical protein
MRLRLLPSLAAAGLGAVLFLAGCATVPPPREVTVSSANYVTTPLDEIAKFIDKPSALNPSAPPLQPLAAPKLYVFVPGETYRSDLPLREICRQLEAVLKRKNYLYLVSEVLSGRRQFAPPDLVLRVHSGERLWRKPVIRVDELTWNEGLVARHRLNSAGASAVTVWDFRAGGDDAGLLDVEAALNPDNDPMNAVSGLALALGQPPSRDYFLIVVEAFLFSELKEKKGEARRQWTTFVAVPKEPGQKFSDVLPGLLRTATPYFGETTRGVQVFDQDRAKVKIGIPYEVPNPPGPLAAPAPR